MRASLLTAAKYKGSKQQVLFWCSALRHCIQRRDGKVTGLSSWSAELFFAISGTIKKMLKKTELHLETRRESQTTISFGRLDEKNAAVKPAVGVAGVDRTMDRL
ncbi:hypothetical protein TRVL_01824 [Trypanosoma vivax]|nr:hypothetical protein TRVL_01824 [Trypanosoma vivax]